ncbi:MAG: FAD-dependent oxidoreductase [Bryobacteraceae bacterium]
MTRSCLIIGAGMSGLTAAAVLQRKGWAVVLLDKGRGVGGRMTTRRIGGSRFDHGAQFFTVRDDRFREAVARWESDRVVAPWFTESGHVRYRGVDGMNGLAKHLAKSLDVRRETKVQRVEPGHEGWCVFTEAGERFSANALLLTAPAPQSAALLAACAEQLPPEMFLTLRSIVFDPCFALLVTLEGASCVPAPGYLRIEKGPIEWIADNTQKGISRGSAALTIHARADFSRRYLESPQDEVAELLLEAARIWLGVNVAAWQLHLWPYSKPIAEPRPPFLFTSKPAPLAIAGDAFAGSRIESAFLSGLSAAEKISSGVF